MLVVDGLDVAVTAVFAIDGFDAAGAPVVPMLGDWVVWSDYAGQTRRDEVVIVDPFSSSEGLDHLELMARIRSVLRRLDMPAPRNRIPSMKAGDLEVDFASQEVRLNDEPVALTPTEYKLLYHLVRNAGRTLTHELLLSRVWGKEYEDELDYLRVYIRRLRDKLHDDPARPRYIQTERGIGYRFVGATQRPQA